MGSVSILSVWNFKRVRIVIKFDNRLWIDWVFKMKKYEDYDNNVNEKIKTRQ